MLKPALSLAAAIVVAATTAPAEGISTHVLDLARGIGGEGIPVTLEMRSEDGWNAVGEGTTAENGRVEAFGADVEGGVYRLTFDLQGYDGFEGGEPPFFPEIAVEFRVVDASEHYHVPIVLSPYGYSTYRGN